MESLLWVGWFLTLLTWGVALKISLDSTKRTEINKSIDLFHSMVRDLEDDALEFWMKDDSSVHEYQLTLRLKRISAAANSIIKLDKHRGFPAEHLAEFRKAITLNIEQRENQIAPNKPRIHKIMIYSVKLQDFYSKAA